MDSKNKKDLKTEDLKKGKKREEKRKDKKGKPFSGLKITVGIDAHLWQWNITIYAGKRLYKTFQQVPEAKVLKNYLEKHFPGAEYYCAYEAGYFGFVSYRELEELGIKGIVINASDIPTTEKEKRRKSDSVDSKKIARSLLNGDLRGIYIPSAELEADRRIVRYRTKTVRQELTRAKQRLKSFLVITGKHREIEGYKSSYWSKKIIKQITDLKFDNDSDQLMLSHHIENLNQAKQKFSKANRQIVLLSKTKRYAILVKRLRTIPGIGLLTAMSLVTEIGEMNRFKTLDKLSSFVGLVPDVSGSDEKLIIKGVTKRAKVELRRLIVQASWIAIRRSPEMMLTYHSQLKKKSIPQKAIIRVCRKLLSIIRAVWLKEEDYQKDYNRDAVLINSEKAA